MQEFAYTKVSNHPAGSPDLLQRRNLVGLGEWTRNSYVRIQNKAREKFQIREEYLKIRKNKELSHYKKPTLGCPMRHNIQKTT